MSGSDRQHTLDRQRAWREHLEAGNDAQAKEIEEELEDEARELETPSQWCDTYDLEDS